MSKHHHSCDSLPFYHVFACCTDSTTNAPQPPCAPNVLLCAPTAYSMYVHCVYAVLCAPTALATCHGFTDSTTFEPPTPCTPSDTTPCTLCQCSTISHCLTACSHSTCTMPVHCVNYVLCATTAFAPCFFCTGSFTNAM